MSTSKPQAIPLPSDPSAITALVALMADAFTQSKDPMYRYLVASEYHLTNKDTPTREQLIENMKPSVEKSLSQGADVQVVMNPEAGSAATGGDVNPFVAAAVWFTPDRPRGPRAITPDSSRAFIEYDEQSRKTKALALRSRPRYHYLHLVGREPTSTIPGSISALMRPTLEAARAENIPVYLEATNEHARDVYAHYGFKLIGEIVVGKAEVDSKGYWDDKGDGVTCWGMVWEPEEN